MSYDLEDTEPAPRARPKAKPPEVGENTFQPANKRPVSSPSATGAARKAKRADGDPRPVTGPGPTLVERILYGSVGSGDLATFCGQFAT